MTSEEVTTAVTTPLDVLSVHRDPSALVDNKMLAISAIHDNGPDDSDPGGLITAVTSTCQGAAGTADRVANESSHSQVCPCLSCSSYVTCFYIYQRYSQPGT